MTPIVLHHGLFGYDTLGVGRFRWSYFRRIDRAIAAQGYPLIVSRVHPTCGIAKRAGQLKQAILEQLGQLGRPDERVIVIGHSMGGLDARYMIRHLDMAGRVAALVSIATPHRGSSYADWCIQHFGCRLGGLAFFNFFGVDLQGCVDVTTGSCRRFNQEVPDLPGVRYFSISAAHPWYRMPPFALHSHKIIQDREGDNDGLVSVRSARWGEHLGTWPADHWQTVNKRFMPEWANPTGDITPYYLELLDHLTERGVALGR